jgi:hypothetical protein
VASGGAPEQPRKGATTQALWQQLAALPENCSFPVAPISHSFSFLFSWQLSKLIHNCLMEIAGNLPELPLGILMDIFSLLEIPTLCVRALSAPLGTPPTPTHASLDGTRSSRHRASSTLQNHLARRLLISTALPSRDPTD